MMEKVELLAPVGHMEGLRAAVANGADAVYIGGAKFGARREAAFDREQLVEAIQFAHLYEVAVYVTVNTTVFDEELDDLTRYIHFLYASGVDAVIVADLGVASLVRELYPDFEMHFSTQMHLHNAPAAGFARRFGASRMVASRENSLAEIEEMVETGIEVEAFVHGALCVCYSGQCLMSSMIGGRSGNRGSCAQPCRLPHELVELASGEVVDGADGKYQLSPRDLKTVDDVGAIIEAGVTSFKIEGRLKSAEYVAAAVRAYRHATDLYLSGEQFEIPKRMSDDLDQVFTRDSTTGFLLGEDGRRWIGPERPGHRGVLIGKVVNVKGQRATVKLLEDLHLQDGLRFIAPSGDEVGMIAQKMFVDGDDVKVASPGLVDMPCPFQPEVGMILYKTTSAELAKRMSEVPLAKIPVYGFVKLRVGEPFLIVVYEHLLNAITVTGTGPVEAADKQGIGEDRLRQQMEKTGSTPFFFDDIVFEVDADATVPISMVNGMRRDALETLEVRRRNPHLEHRQPSTAQVAVPTPFVQNEKPHLRVSVRNLAQLEVVCASSEVDVIYYKDFPTLTKALSIAESYGKVLIPQLERVVSDDQVKAVVETLKDLRISQVMAGEYGMLEALRDSGIELLTDQTFHTNNTQHVEALRQLGVLGCTASYEISGRQLRSLVSQSPLSTEVVVFGRIPLMVTKHCPVKAAMESGAGPCRDRHCEQTAFGLRDRKGCVMPLIQTGSCLMEIYSHQHLILLEQLQEMVACGVSRFRLAFSNETEDEIREAIGAFSLGLTTGNLDGRWLAAYKETDRFTTGRQGKGVE